MTRTTTFLAVAALAACGGGGGTDEADAATPPAAPAGPLRATPLASGLVNPWSLAFLPDGRMLVRAGCGWSRPAAARFRRPSPGCRPWMPEGRAASST